MNRIVWVLEKNEDRRFPYKLYIKTSREIILSLLVQDRWPGQKGNIFCLPLKDETPEPSKIIEEVPVVSLKRYGKRLVVVLDRPQRKRCDFLFLKKKYKNRDDYYEQIFWRTEQALKSRRPKVKLTTYPRTQALNILIDISERYPWNLPGRTERARLPVGDYALMDERGIVAVIERKTFDNMVAEFGRMAAFHQQLSELESYEYPALVIEAHYSDFLDPKRMKYYSPAFGAKAIAEIHALHPELPVIFAGNRKLAQQWAGNFFQAVWNSLQDKPLLKVAEPSETYGGTESSRGGQFFELKNKILDSLPEEFTFGQLRHLYPDVQETTLRRLLNTFKTEGTITCTGRGPRAIWKKIR